MNTKIKIMPQADVDRLLKLVNDTYAGDSTIWFVDVIVANYIFDVLRRSKKEITKELVELHVLQLIDNFVFFTVERVLSLLSDSTRLNLK